MVAAILALLPAAHAVAHSASDAYLTLEAVSHGKATETVVRAQWDVALRDLDFVLGLDADGDGRITWGEVRRRQSAIAKLAYAGLDVNGAGQSCKIRPTRQVITEHADGAYAALFFDIACKGAPAQLTLDYRLFFSVDPSHRCIVVLRGSGGVATALLSPANARISFPL